MGYKEIVEKSFRITWKYKWLWVWALFLLPFVGGGGNYSSNFNSFGNHSSNTQTGNMANADFPKIEKLFVDSIGNHYLEVIKNIPVSFWIFLVLSIILVTLFGVVYGIFIRNWLSGGMIKLSYEAINDGKVDIETGARAGFASFWNLFLASFIIGLIGFGLGLAMALLVIFLVFLGTLAPLLYIILILLALPLLVAFIGLTIYFTLAEIVASRLIVIGEYQAIPAIKKAFVLAKRNFFRMLGMGVVNLGVGCLGSCLLMTVLVPVLIATVGGVALGVVVIKQYILLLAPIFGILFLAFMLLSQLISAILLVYKYNTWSFIYKDLEKENE